MCAKPVAGIPALMNHRIQPNANSIGAGNSKSSCLKDDHRKGRGLDKLNAPLISDQKFQLRFNRYCRLKNTHILKWWQKSELKTKRISYFTIESNTGVITAIRYCSVFRSKRNFLLKMIIFIAGLQYAGISDCCILRTSYTQHKVHKESYFFQRTLLS